MNCESIWFWDTATRLDETYLTLVRLESLIEKAHASRLFFFCIPSWKDDPIPKGDAPDSDLDSAASLCIKYVSFETGLQTLKRHLIMKVY